MKIIFVGCLESSHNLLEVALGSSAEVVGVITREKSSFNADFVDLTPLAESHGIPYAYFNNVNSAESIQWIQDLKADVMFCFGWSYLIKKTVLDLLPMGVVGYHPSALPKNRGRHPSIWPLILGMDQTASTFFFMDEGADSGDILSQETIEIKREDYARDLYNNLMITARRQVKAFIPQLADNSYTRISQDHTLANHWRKRGRADGKIDFRMHSEVIYNLVRGLSKPYVGAHIEYNGEDIKVWKVEVVSNTLTNIEPGKVLEAGAGGLLVKTADGAVSIVEHGFNELPQAGEYL